MTSDPSILRLLATVLVTDPAGPLPRRLSTQAMAMLQVDAMTVTLLSTPDHRHVVWASDQEVMREQDVQHTLGEGPVVAAFHDNDAVLVADLPTQAQSRWPMLASEYGHNPRYASVLALPLNVDLHRPIGVLSLYTHRPRRLDDVTITDAQVLAQVLAHAIARAVLSQPDPGGPGHPPHPDDAGTEPQTALHQWEDAEHVVHQAVGMAVVQLDLPPLQALARLRAHAFAETTTLDQVAQAVVERRLRLQA